MTASGVGSRQASVRVRPKQSLLGDAFASIVLGTTPIFAVVYWFTSSRGGTAVALLAHLIVIVVALLLLWRQLRVFCAVENGELIGNGIFTTLVRVPLARIRRVQLIPTYLGAAPEPVLQLLVTGEDGRRLFRMRGTYWHTEDLRALAAALPVPVEEPGDAISMREFFTTHPGSAYWYENRGALTVIVAVLGTIALLAGAAWVMGMLGLPVRIL